jgi:hypothetical protein
VLRDAEAASLLAGAAAADGGGGDAGGSTGAAAGVSPPDDSAGAKRARTRSVKDTCAALRVVCVRVWRSARPRLKRVRAGLRELGLCGAAGRYARDVTCGRCGGVRKRGGRRGQRARRGRNCRLSSLLVILSLRCACVFYAGAGTCERLGSAGVHTTPCAVT